VPPPTINIPSGCSHWSLETPVGKLEFTFVQFMQWCNYGGGSRGAGAFAPGRSRRGGEKTVLPKYFRLTNAKMSMAMFAG